MTPPPTGSAGGSQEPPAADGTFGAGAGEMAAETEVEAPLTDQGASAPARTADKSGDKPADSSTAEEDIAKARSDVAALTADLQRLQAEYLNYKRRVDRDRQLVAENAAYKALLPVIEVLDTVDRAREAGEVDGGFKAVAEQLERAVAVSGLSRFGAAGDAFDPQLHEALSHLGEDPDVAVTTVKVVAKGGYRMGERVVRAAQVLVVDPASSPAAPADSEQSTGEPQDQSGEPDPASETGIPPSS
ncbi:nucleotide exchange factor GrpE [Nocardioides houyundeii]|uniref:nucleotide exchange factor GrpE n=1 Tax=Nocardioides houyundeii TaxID=2045452 RepID=UPI001F538045|nr:nucleotide exchange factor GrpE [Nocardioides houyundeii]